MTKTSKQNLFAAPVFAALLLAGGSAMATDVRQLGVGDISQDPSYAHLHGLQSDSSRTEVRAHAVNTPPAAGQSSAGERSPQAPSDLTREQVREQARTAMRQGEVATGS